MASTVSQHGREVKIHMNQDVTYTSGWIPSPSCMDQVLLMETRMNAIGILPSLNQRRIGKAYILGGARVYIKAFYSTPITHQSQNQY